MKDSRHDRAIALLLDGVCRQTGHGVLFYDREKRNFRTGGVLPPFCRGCLRNPGLAERCRAVYEEAGRNALNTGEAFHYTCWAGLMLVAVAVAPFTRRLGCAAIGGFQPAAPDGGERAAAPGAPRNRPETIPGTEPLAGAPAISTVQMRGLGAYLQDASFACGLNSAAYFRRRHAIYLQQRTIAEHSQRLGAANITPSALVRRADALVEAIVRPGEERRRRLGAAYLAMVLRASNWDIVRLKAHLRVPLALLTRNAMLKRQDSATAARAELRFAERLDQAGTIEDVCYLFHEILVDSAARAAEHGKITPAISERAGRWLESNYQKPATLGMAARAIGASAPSIIQHVKRDTGKTFHALLLEIRIAEAKRLLAAAGLDLSAIAQQCGFCDQSHFTRHFRNATNLTPGQFRKLMKVSEADITRTKNN